MERRILAAALCCILCINSFCARVDLRKAGLVKVSGHVYAFIAYGPSSEEGLGANSGFIVGTRGVLVVDSRFTPGLARDLLESVKSVTGAPVLYAVNTHYHPDHCWGNSVLKEAGAVIVSRPETRTSMEKFSGAYLDYYQFFKPDVYEMLRGLEVVLPDTTFGDELRIDLGGVEVVLRYFGPAHTAGDCIVSVPSEGVVFAGGLLANGYHANVSDEGADIDNWIAALDEVGRMKPKFIVPGQGFVCRPDEIGKQQKYLRTLGELCIDAIRRSLPVDKAALSITVPGAQDYLQPNILSFNVRSLYRSGVEGVVRPDFSLETPPDFVIADGGGDVKRGHMRWTCDGDAGFFEIEVRWQPTMHRELIVQDIGDAVARFNQEGELYRMQIDGSKQIDIGGENAPAMFGTWSYKGERSVRGGGPWTWAMALRGDRLYSIRLLTFAERDEKKERENIALLERIASSFRSPLPRE